MKCPICKGRGHIQLDLHADGFSQDARECGNCGVVWTFSGDTMKIIREKRVNTEKSYSELSCPTCKSMTCIETDLNAFQFHEEIEECVNCGTVFSRAHNLLEIVKDSQANSFLSSIAETVEADDYAFI